MTLEEKTLPGGRTYWVHSPATPVTSIFFLHNGGSPGGEDFAAKTDAVALADEFNFKAVLPEGLDYGMPDPDRHWNAGPLYANPAEQAGTDDTTYLFDVMFEEQISGKKWVVGGSNGGMMAYRLASEWYVDGLAVSAAADVTGVANPFRSTAVCHWHGALDPTVPIHGGPFPPPAATIGGYVAENYPLSYEYKVGSAEADIHIWKGGNNTVRYRVFTGLGHTGFPSNRWRFLVKFLLGQGGYI